MSADGGHAGIGCLSGVVCLISGIVAWATYAEGPAAVFWIAAVVCGLALLVTLVAFGALGEFLLELLEAALSGFGRD